MSLIIIINLSYLRIIIVHMVQQWFPKWGEPKAVLRAVVWKSFFVMLIDNAYHNAYQRHFLLTASVGSLSPQRSSLV